MEQMLVEIGLTKAQAGVYLFLLDNGESSPTVIAKATHLTRTNAYKVLERLEHIGLVEKADSKKIQYRACDPTSLASLVAEERNKIISLEQGVTEAMHELRKKYLKVSGGLSTQVINGKESIESSLLQHSSKGETIHFVRSRADIPFMGYGAMDQIRNAAKDRGAQRFGIVPDSPESPSNPEIDKRTNLKRTWIPPSDYNSPVEWSVSGNELIIIVYDNDGAAIIIENEEVAESFRQLWALADKNIRSNEKYTPIGPLAKRKS